MRALILVDVDILLYDETLSTCTSFNMSEEVGEDDSIGFSCIPVALRGEVKVSLKFLRSNEIRSEPKQVRRNRRTKNC
jgi:hypothetical protein